MNQLKEKATKEQNNCFRCEEAGGRDRFRTKCLRKHVRNFPLKLL